MCRILSQIRAPGIRVLVISLGIIFNPDNIGRTVAQLGSVAGAVSKAGAFEDLEQLTINLYDLLDVTIGEDVYASVCDVFKHFEERGLLMIEGANRRYSRPYYSAYDELILPMWSKNHRLGSTLCPVEGMKSAACSMPSSYSTPVHTLTSPGYRRIQAPSNPNINDQKAPTPLRSHS